MNSAMTDDQSLPAPPTDNIDPGDLHTLTSPLEIQSVLRNVKLNRALVHIYIQGQNTSAITSILDVNAKTSLVTFDALNDASLNQQIQQAQKLIAQTSLDRIQVKFICPPVSPCDFDDKPAFQAATPAAMSYLQRRDAYRIETPVATPVICTITVSTNQQTRKFKLPLADISNGGVGLYDELQLPETSIGTVYEDCQISLPNVGSLNIALRIQYLTEQPLTNGKPRLRLGCAFVSPSGTAINMVQRYTGRLERELLAKKRGFG